MFLVFDNLKFLDITISSADICILDILFNPEEKHFVATMEYKYSNVCVSFTMIR